MVHAAVSQRTHLLWFAPGVALVMLGAGVLLRPQWLYPLLALFFCVLGLWLIAAIAFARRVFQMVNRLGSNVVAQVRIAGAAPPGPFEQSPDGEIKKVVLH